MPSDEKTGWGKSFVKYRVKLGKKVVHVAERKGDAEEWARRNKHLGKLKVLAPNAPKRH